MTIKILHTADLHLGMRFASGDYTPQLQEGLSKARFETLDTLIKVANKQQSDLLIIAGDLFHSPRVSRGDILRAATRLKDFEGRLILILPGNHDYIQKSDDPIWPNFVNNVSQNTILLTDPKPYDLRSHGLDLTVYPAPCMSRHSKTNVVGWVPESIKDKQTTLSVGIAHGSVEGLSPDFNQDYYPMSKTELQAAGVDLWLMGHTHIRYPDEEEGTQAHIFFPSTPEPDGFDCRHPGYVWFIEITENKSIHYYSIQTGSYQFFDLERQIKNEGDIEKIKTEFRGMNAEKHLVKLKLKGRIHNELYDEQESLLGELEKLVLYLASDTSELFRQITPKDIDQEFTSGSFPHRLLTALATKNSDPLLLQTAYDLIQEARK